MKKDVFRVFFATYLDEEFNDVILIIKQNQYVYADILRIEK